MTGRGEYASRIRVALYARVSTNEQTAENQLRALHEHAERAGWTVVAEFTDAAVSGTREKRPGLDALLADTRRRKFDLIAVAALDRLGRNLRHLVTLLDELQHLGVGLVSLREALDLSSPIGRAMFALVGVLAEVERAWIVERTHAGLKRAGAGEATWPAARDPRHRQAPASPRWRLQHSRRRPYPPRFRSNRPPDAPDGTATPLTHTRRPLMSHPPPAGLGPSRVSISSGAVLFFWLVLA